MRPKAGWAGLIYHPQTPSGQNPEDEPMQGIDGYGGKDFEKRTL